MFPKLLRFQLSKQQQMILSLFLFFLIGILLTAPLFAQSTSLYQDQPARTATYAQQRPDTRMTATYIDSPAHQQPPQSRPPQRHRNQMRPYVQPKPLVSMRYSGIPQLDANATSSPRGPIAPSIREYSRLVVVSPPERRYAKHDLITIIISERASDSADTKLETEKEMAVSASVDEFPNLDVRNLFRAIIGGNTLTNPPKVKASAENEFTGESTHENTSSFSAQITAEVIDIKPNGNLVLEARKNIRIDKETMGIVMTGICRPKDISVDNTIMSTKVANLRLTKAHEGEMRKVKKKGFLTKFFEFIVPF